MRPPAVVIPFKAEGHKSRLSPRLGPDERRQVAYLLLTGTLDTVRRAGMGGLCFVVSPDPEAQRLARRKGVKFIMEPRAAGVNSAVRLALRRLLTARRFVVIPSDLPLLVAREIRDAVRLGETFDVVIAPSSSFNGTNLLLFRRDRPPRLSYDMDSFWNHLGDAARKGLTTAVFASGGVVFDLDSPADIEQLRRAAPRSPVAAYIRKSLAK